MKAQKIYDITMALIDEMLDNGQVDIASTRDYLARTPGILTILQNELTPEVLDPIKDMESEVDLDDKICMAVLPYGLAARLLMQEDETGRLSSFFSSLYDTNRLKMTTKGKREKIVDKYGSNLRVGG